MSRCLGFVSRAFCLTLVLLGADGLRAASGPPNFLVLITDDQRPDTVSALGNADIRTPNLDRLTREGLSLTRATCSFPLCVPSRAEILTGATGWQNGVPYAGGKLRPEMVFWAEVFQKAGYHTWYVGKWMNDGSPKTRGYEETHGLFSSGGAGEEGRKPVYGRKGRLITGYRGWTFKTDDGEVETHKGIGITAETSRHIGAAAEELLLRKTDRPFFLHVNFTAPHDPLVFPPGYEEKYDPARLALPGNLLPEHPFDHGNFNGRDEKLLPWPRTEAEVRDEWAAYYAVLEDMDAQVGRLLQALEKSGRLANTHIIFSSDHGLALGSHGLMGKQNMYEHTIGVPLIWRGPGVMSGRRSRAQCFLRDLFPTTCDLAGLDIPGTVQGKSLAPVLRGEADQVHPFVTGYFYDFQRMIRTDRWKLVYYPHLDRVQLFDLKQDPLEVKDVSSAPLNDEIRRELWTRMVGWFQSQGDMVFGTGAP